MLANLFPVFVFLKCVQWLCVALCPLLKAHLPLSSWVTLQAIWAHQTFINPNLLLLLPSTQPLFSSFCFSNSPQRFCSISIFYLKKFDQEGWALSFLLEIQFYSTWWGCIVPDDLKSKLCTMDMRVSRMKLNRLDLWMYLPQGWKL